MLKKNMLTFSVGAYLLINLLFVLKYTLRIFPVTVSVACCAAYIVLFLLVCRCAMLLVSRLSGKWMMALVASVLLLLVVAQWSIDPYSLQVDRWSAIHNFIYNLLHGEYPYAAETHLGGYGSPFPVWQLVHVPFYLAGNVGLSFVVGVVLFIDALRRQYTLTTGIMAFVLLLLSPAFIYEVMVRSDLITNFLFSISILLYLIHFKIDFKSHYLSLALLGGLLLSTRFSAVIPLCIYFFPQFVRAGWKRQISFMVLAAIVFCLTFLPFLLWDGDMLLFFEYNPFVLQTRQGHISDILFMVCVGIFLSLHWRGNTERCLFYIALSLILLVVVTFVHNMYDDNSWDKLFESQYDITYFNMSIPFLIAVISRLITKKRATEKAVTSNKETL